MLFYLDKELAKQGIAKCIAVSETLIDKQELEERKLCFNVKEILIFEGNDIPHKFKFNENLDNIEEFIEVEEQSALFAEDKALQTESESDFDESISIDINKQYFYIDKEYADQNFQSQIIAVFQKPLKNPAKYFNKEVYCHIGKDIPFYITIEKDKIREATEFEKYQRKQRVLEENEYVSDNQILTYDTTFEYIDHQGIKQTKTRKQLVDEKIITLESEKEKARAEREKGLQALDLYDKAVLRGDIVETPEGKISRDNYRTAWLELPNNYVDVMIPIETLYPIAPAAIKYFA
ncbi:hypothetical protein [Fusobacterium sp.]|uniref:hypothetical protein n=1 Tax=Fusobacterium sp. TaxID=68766 RepID=UPI001DED4C92|nr:hypothetical protein [Fusobacterium sp.]MBS5790113.1 hypothetical protein [Fusobacterium sp.]